MKIKHGGVGTLLYQVWCGMKQRCSYAKHVSYANYGARGIQVCPQWLNDFAAFREWAEAHGYQQGLLLDRENNDGSYSPQNCRWVTAFRSVANRRYSRLTVADAAVIKSLTLLGNPTKLIAALYGVPMAKVSQIKNGHNWAQASTMFV